MKTVLLLTPEDHGRRVTPEEWETAQSSGGGYKYEIIDGVIQVSPPPDWDHDGIADWLHRVFVLYQVAHLDVISRISQRCAVRVPDRPDLTEPEPDFGLYRVPAGTAGVRWHEVEPFLVVEILSEGTQRKDLVRNVRLYARVPGIREYWVIDPLPNWLEPTLRVHRRRGTGTRWQRPIIVGPGQTYETPQLLPGFSLRLDPRAV